MPPPAQSRSRWPARLDSRSGRSSCWTRRRAPPGRRTSSGRTWQIWASPDYRVVWQKHNPAYRGVDDFDAGQYPYTAASAGCWFSNCDRPTNEMHQITAISGNTITFNSPVTISYRASHKAQLYAYSASFVQNAGVENMTLSGGDDGNLRFAQAAYCWAQNVERHDVAQRRVGDRLLVPHPAGGVLRPQRRLAGQRRRRLRHQPLSRVIRSADRERHFGARQQGDGGALLRRRLGRRVQLHGRRLYQRVRTPGSRLGSTAAIWSAAITCCSRATTASTRTATRRTEIRSITPISATI